MASFGDENCSDNDDNEFYEVLDDSNYDKLLKKCKSITPELRVTRSKSLAKSKVNLDKTYGKDFLRLPANPVNKVSGGDDKAKGGLVNTKGAVKDMINDLNEDFNRLHGKFDKIYFVLDNLIDRVDLMEERENEHQLLHEENERRIADLESKNEENERRSRLNKVLLTYPQLNNESKSLQNETRKFLEESLKLDSAIVNKTKVSKFGKEKHTVLLEMPSIDAKLELFRIKKLLTTNEDDEKNLVNLYVNDFLTPKRVEILKRARVMKKSKKLDSVFSINGIVYIRVNKDAKAKPIHCISDLPKI